MAQHGRQIAAAKPWLLSSPTAQDRRNMHSLSFYMASMAWIAGRSMRWLGLNPEMKTYSLREARRLAIGTNDWREGIWNRWLVGYLTPRDDDSADQGQATPKAAPTTPAAPQAISDSASPGETASDAQCARKLDVTEGASCDAPTRAPTVRPGPLRAKSDLLSNPLDDAERDSSYSPALDSETGGGEWGRARRVHTLRTRLDQIVGQLDTLELALDRQSEREGLARVQDRVQQRALSDILDRLVEAQERHTQGLISCTRAVERLERRLISMERITRSSQSIAPEASYGDTSPFAPAATESIVPASMTQRVRKTSASSPPADHAAPLSGKLSEISLPTLLSMAELERWTGRLMIDAHTRTVLLDLEAGFLVGVFEDDSPSDAVETLYDLIEVRDGGFSFNPQHSVAKTELAPMTVGTLLLRASHRRDEVTRLEVGM